jgi:outer membrane protein assembly factor BamE (lipoprotein component of BamABCDE complex)
MLAGCASQLPPGASAVQVESVMGRPAERRTEPNGDTVLWYPRMPYGDGSYAARFGPDGRLISLEQRITEENVARIERGKTTADQVRDLVGPPYRIDQYPRMDREIWTYKIGQVFPFPKALFVQFSPDHIVREVYFMDDPEVPRRGSRSAGLFFR